MAIYGAIDPERGARARDGDGDGERERERLTEFFGGKRLATHVVAFACGALVACVAGGVRDVAYVGLGDAETIEAAIETPVARGPPKDGQVIRNVFACREGFEPRCAPVEVECGANEIRGPNGCEPCPAATPYRCPVPGGGGALADACSAVSRVIADGELKTAINVCNVNRTWNGCDCDVKTWDVSAVKNCAHLFEGGPFETFNEDVSAWDTSSCTDMQLAFAGAKKFNQPIGSWNTANSKNFFGMFSGAFEFSQDLSSWDLNAATQTRGMFWQTRKIPRSGVPAAVRGNNNAAPSSGPGRCCYQ